MSRYKSKLVTLLDEAESQVPEFYELNGYERKYIIEGQLGYCNFIYIKCNGLVFCNN